jgi:pilus assembly protein Flp/PilA
MKKALEIIRRVSRDEDGATMVEYSVLLGIMLVGAIVAIGTVGTWVGTQWSTLAGAL